MSSTGSFWDAPVHLDRRGGSRRDAAARLLARGVSMSEVIDILLADARFANPAGGKGDLDPAGHWVTITGQHLHITGGGEIDAGGNPKLREVLESKAGLKAATSGAAAPGEDGESRGMLASWQKAIAQGIDPGKEVRTAARKWLNNTATDDQLNYVAGKLGVASLPGADGSDVSSAVARHLEKAMRHPGEQAVEGDSLRATLQNALAGKPGNVLDPASVAAKLHGYGPDEAEYLAKSLGLHQPGKSEAEQKKAIHDAAVAAHDELVNAPEVASAVAGVQGVIASKKGATDAEQTALRDTLSAMNGTSVARVYEALGLGLASGSPSGMIEKIMPLLRAKLGDRLAADTAALSHVAALSALYQGDYRQKNDRVLELQNRMADIVKKGLDPKAGGYFDLQKESESLAKSLDADRQKHRDSLYGMLAPVATPAWKVEALKGVGPKQKQAAAGALDFYARTLSGRDGDPPELAAVTLKSTKSRAFAVNHSVGVATVALASESVATAVHEFGHVIEVCRPGVKDLANEFLAHRGCDSEPSVSLKKKYPGMGYTGDERGKKDHFDRYFGDTVAAYYTGKTYSDKTTEIISVGMETLYRDPAGFCARDPEYAQFVLGILKGTVR